MVVGLACSGGAGRSRTDLLGFAIRCITALLPRHWILWNVSSAAFALEQEFGAGNESRTRDLNLGKVALYQLSYSRIRKERYITLIKKDLSRKKRRFLTVEMLFFCWFLLFWRLINGVVR